MSVQTTPFPRLPGERSPRVQRGTRRATPRSETGAPYFQSVEDTHVAPARSEPGAPSRRVWLRRAAQAALCALFVLVLASCTEIAVNDRNDATQPTLNSTIISAESNPWITGEVDARLLNAESVRANPRPTTIKGTIRSENDLAVFDLGPVEPGDHVVVEMRTTAGLDGAMALFDENGTLLLVDDHRNIVLGRQGVYLEAVIRRPSSACYVVVTGAPGFGSAGDFTVVATTTPAQPLPEPHPDEVLLVFDGGSDVRIGGRAPVDVPAFDAGRISPAFERFTAEIIAQVTARIRDDYAPFDVTIRSTFEGAEFDGFMTRVYFGTFDPSLLGIAQGVDEFNVQQTQTAIVFTDTFEAFASLRPTTEEISNALANVASHEIGHLLGLVHTADPRGIMDVTASLRELMHRQHFRRSPVHQEVFPMGYVDEVQSLLDAVGGDAGLAFAMNDSLLVESGQVAAKADVRSARIVHRLSSCGLHDRVAP